MKFVYAVLGFVGIFLIADRLVACPFCSPPGPTLAEEIHDAAVVVIGKYLGKAATTNGNEPALDRFEIVRTLKPHAQLQGVQQIQTLLVGEHPLGSRFFLVGHDDDGLVWDQPLVVSPRAESFLAELRSLPNTGPERIRFFLPYLFDREPFLRDDAYDEFAKAPYVDVKTLRPHLQREQLIAAVQDRETETRFRRLYLTLLGISGTSDDAALLESWIAKHDGIYTSSLDAIVACYLTLRGAEGLSFIERELLQRPDVSFQEIYSTHLALRFHGEEEQQIERRRLAQALRLLLAQAKSAELVIPDLARWEDWSPLQEIAKFFHADYERQRSLRVLVVQYLHACPLPAAKTQLEAFRQLDPEVVKHGLSPFTVARRPPKTENRSVRPADNQD